MTDIQLIEQEVGGTSTATIACDAPVSEVEAPEIPDDSSSEAEQKYAFVSTKPHKTVNVVVGDHEADIDEDLAPLIEQLWKANIMTANSCQEVKPGVAWIEFVRTIDANRFMNLVCGAYSHDIDSLYNRIRNAWDSGGKETKGLWEYACHPDDWAVDSFYVNDSEVDEMPIGQPDFKFSISIRFPRTDIPVLFDRMSQFNGGGEVKV